VEDGVRVVEEVDRVVATAAKEAVESRDEERIEPGGAGETGMNRDTGGAQFLPNRTRLPQCQDLDPKRQVRQPSNEMGEDALGATEGEGGANK
jgi:hypothetical protein